VLSGHAAGAGAKRSSRQPDLLTEHRIELLDGITSHDYLDAWKHLHALVAPPGLLEIRNDCIIRDSGQPDAVVSDAQQWDVSALPDEALMYLLGSRYCDTQKLSGLAWSLKDLPKVRDISERIALLFVGYRILSSVPIGT
jgi:hypothetical protein